MKSKKRKLLKRITVSLGMLVVIFTIITALRVNNIYANETEGAKKAQIEITENKATVIKWGLIAAAIAFGLGAIGAGIAIGNVGSAAMGAIGEKPEIANQALIFVALAEGLVVFGFIASLMILGKV